jgi:hypothetical protein
VNFEKTSSRPNISVLLLLLLLLPLIGPGSSERLWSSWGSSELTKNGRG